MAEYCCCDICRRANEEVRGECSMEQDIVDKQKQWISVALRTESESASSTKHNGKSYALSVGCFNILMSFLCIRQRQAAKALIVLVVGPAVCPSVC